MEASESGTMYLVTAIMIVVAFWLCPLCTFAESRMRDLKLFIASMYAMYGDGDGWQATQPYWGAILAMWREMGFAIPSLGAMLEEHVAIFNTSVSTIAQVLYGEEVSAVCAGLEVGGARSHPTERT
jgi:hypothetical protein